MFVFLLLTLQLYIAHDTLKSPPPENKIMKKATRMGLSVTMLFYMSIGLVGYATFGNDAPRNMLTGFGFYKPFWLIDIANLCIVIHIVGAYQISWYCMFTLFITIHFPLD